MHPHHVHHHAHEESAPTYEELAREERRPSPGQQGVPHVVSLREAPQVQQGGSIDLKPLTGEQNIIRLHYPTPRQLGATVLIDLLDNPLIEQQIEFNQFAIPGIDPVDGLVELWIYLRIRFGMQGALVEAFCDLPVGQVVQIGCVASTLEISAGVMRVSEPISFFNLNVRNFPKPVPFNGPLAFSGNPATFAVFIKGIAGNGFVQTNATRHARLPDLVSSGGPNTFNNIPLPNFCNTFRVYGKESTFSWQATWPGSVFPLGPISVDSPTEFQLPENADQITIRNTAPPGSGRASAEVVFRLGISGDPAV
jgi:hypothetical protein